MITREFAEHFAKEWIESWNNHDLVRILSHYSNDFTMSSPRIAVVANEPSGVLKGKTAIGEYWRKALDLAPSLRFDLIATYTGADSLALCYNGPRGPAIEVFFFSEQGQVIKAAAHYA